MEKISHIIPSTPRVRSVDTESSLPLRPGAPAQGRREIDRVRDGDVQESMNESVNDVVDLKNSQTSNSNKSSNKNNARIAEVISDRFFNLRLVQPNKDKPQNLDKTQNSNESSKQNAPKEYSSSNSINDSSSESNGNYSKDGTIVPVSKENLSDHKIDLNS